jgi:hypothetical protein
MTRPGVEIINRDAPLPRSAPTDTGVWFVVGETTTGAAEPTLVRSMSDYAGLYGERGGFTTLYDAVDAYFREGGAKVWIAALGDDNPDKPAGGFTEAEKLAALDLFTSTLGPGQVSIPGEVSSTAHTAIMQHAAAYNRVALLDSSGGATAAELAAAAVALNTDDNARYASLWGPHAIIPGVTAGTTRDVGFAAIEAGIIARNDASMNPNVPAAGVNGQAVYALGLSDTYTDQEYEDLNYSGVCMAREMLGGVRAYGYRTLVDSTTVPLWVSFGNARLRMAIVAQAENIAERYVFTLLDGRRRTINDFGAELSGMLVPFYESGALYGATAQEAFHVDVGAQVNTEATIAAGELHAVIEVRMSPFAELVVIEIVKVATTEALAA